MVSLVSLLAQQAAGNTPVVEPLLPNPDQILVQANNAPAPVEGDPLGPRPPNLSNTRYVNEAHTVNTDNERRDGGRTGLFGVRGTLRDLLGQMSDSWLGRDTYRQTRQRERLSDAMLGFTADPTAAAERVTYYDPEAGVDLFNQVQERQAAAAAQASLDSNRRLAEENRLRDDADRLRARAAAMFNRAGNNPENVAFALRSLEQQARATGLSLDQLGIVEGMTPEQLAVYTAGNWTLDNQMMFPLRERQVDINDRNATTNERRAAETARSNRVDEQNAARRLDITEQNYDVQAAARVAGQIGNIPASRRTPAQQEFYDRWTAGENPAIPSENTTIPTRSGRSFRVVN